jgi:urease accessory protein
MTLITTRRSLAFAGAFLAGLSPGLALAHHGIEGRTPETWAEGLTSGLAHPILGLDHLVFLLAAGLAAGALRLGLRIPGLFILASVAGLALHLARIDLPLAEAAVAATILALGLAAGSRSGIGRKGWALLFVVAGLCHGYAYGESIVGASAVPLAGYLLGIGVVQGVLATLTYIAGDKLADGVGHARAELRHLGALLAVIGVAFFVAALRTTA